MESNIDKFNFVICIVAVGENYVNKTISFIQEINKHTNFNFLVLTNRPNSFDNFLNVDVITYDRKIFSYHDKRLVISKAFDNFDYVILMDADHTLREKNTITQIKNIKLESGLYPQLIWRHPIDCSFENFILGNTPRVPYGREYKEYCEKIGLELDNIFLIQESFIIFSKNENTEKFIKIWENLAFFCETKDIERNQSILGYGEGYTIGVAARNSGLLINDKHPIIGEFTKNFKHLAWEK